MGVRMRGSAGSAVILMRQRHCRARRSLAGQSEIITSHHLRGREMRGLLSGVLCCTKMRIQYSEAGSLMDSSTMIDACRLSTLGLNRYCRLLVVDNTFESRKSVKNSQTCSVICAR